MNNRVYYPKHTLRLTERKVNSLKGDLYQILTKTQHSDTDQKKLYQCLQ